MHRGYDATGAYNASKLANVLFTLELQRRLTEAGSRVRAVTAHPGIDYGMVLERSSVLVDLRGVTRKLATAPSLAEVALEPAGQPLAALASH